MEQYMVLLSNGAVYVKERNFFELQGGLVGNWGSNWILVEAESIEDARKIGKELMQSVISKALESPKF